MNAYLPCGWGHATLDPSWEHIGAVSIVQGTALSAAARLRGLTPRESLAYDPDQASPASPPTVPDGKPLRLWALSDLHVSHPENRGLLIVPLFPLYDYSSTASPSGRCPWDTRTSGTVGGASAHTCGR